MLFLTEDKKKMYYYYSGKEKKAGEIKKQAHEMSPYQQNVDMMMERFQHDFDDFWGMPRQMRHWMRRRPMFGMMPFKMPSIDIEDMGKDFRVTADLPGFSKEDVNIEVGEDSILIHAKKSMSEEEKNKNYIRQERTSQTFYRRVQLPEKVKSDDAKASLNNGILEITLPKKEPKETKKLQIT